MFLAVTHEQMYLSILGQDKRLSVEEDPADGLLHLLVKDRFDSALIL